MTRLTWVFVLMAIIGTATALMIEKGRAAREWSDSFLGRCIEESGMTERQCIWIKENVKARIR